MGFSLRILEAADILINVVVVGTCCRKLRANRIKEGEKREKKRKKREGRERKKREKKKKSLEKKNCLSGHVNVILIIVTGTFVCELWNFISF